MALPVAPIHPQTLFSVLDFLGVAVASAGGALAARQHRKHPYDIVGALGLALASGLGGGIARDVLLQHGTPLSLMNVNYLYTALGGAVLALWLGEAIGDRAQRWMLWIDAASLGLFAVAGTSRADSFGLNWLPAVMLGITTAVGGGSLRDVLSGMTPRVFERGNFYAIAAFWAALVYLGMKRLGMPDLACVTAGVVGGFVLRMLSVVFDWKTAKLRD
jgi:uncharacterized membrane protein YeiH